MSTTVTPFTISAVSLTSSLAWIVLLTLLVLLIKKEAVTAATSKWATRLEPSLNIAIIPFMMVFVMLWQSRLIDLLR